MASVPVLALPFMFDLTAELNATLTLAAWRMWALFVIEYLTLFALAPNRWHMVRTHVFD